jgi:hypothetical protein
MKSECIEFQGIRYIRYPESKEADRRKYYDAQIKQGKHYKTIRLHRSIWEYYNSEIPDGYDIHHKDLNPLNNDISNLECISKSEHAFRHKERSSNVLSEWLKTDESKVWRLQHNRDIWKDRQPITKVCECCGEEYQTRTVKVATTKFCSEYCGNKFRRHKKHQTT